MHEPDGFFLRHVDHMTESPLDGDTFKILCVGEESVNQVHETFPSLGGHLPTLYHKTGIEKRFSEDRLSLGNATREKEVTVP